VRGGREGPEEGEGKERKGRGKKVGWEKGKKRKGEPTSKTGGRRGVEDNVQITYYMTLNYIRPIYC